MDPMAEGPGTVAGSAGRPEQREHPVQIALLAVDQSSRIIALRRRTVEHAVQQIMMVDS